MAISDNDVIYAVRKLCPTKNTIVQCAIVCYSIYNIKI